MKNLLARPDLNVAVIDLEASSLNPRSFPIEVGVALIGPVGTPIRTWSTLLKPTSNWVEDGHWSKQSETVHGINLDELVELGSEASEVADALNRILAGCQAVVSDAPTYDQPWLHELFRAGDHEQGFILRSLDALTRDFSPDQHRQFRFLLRRDRPPHRAGPDALRLALRLMEAHLGYVPQHIAVN